MLVIRLARTGRAKYPTYRIVAAESARAATGRFVAVLGHYNPHTKELVVNREETQKHLGNGAQPSPSVIKLLVREGVELPAWVKVKKHEAKLKADETQAAGAAADTDVTPDEAAAEAGEEGAAPDAAEEADDEKRVGTVATEHENAIEPNQVAEADPSDTALTDTAALAAQEIEEQQDIDAASEQIAKNASKDK